MPIDESKKKVITFLNKNKALAVSPVSGDTMEETVTALNLGPYKAVILILGGADSLDDKFKPQLTQLFGRGIAPAAKDAEAVIIDGGTQSGVMSLMGEGVADRGHATQLIGIAPASLVSYPDSAPTEIKLEPNHSHFILVEGDKWDSKTNMMFDLVKVLSSRTVAANSNLSGQAAVNTSGSLPKLALLAGGGETTKKEALLTVRQKLPLIIFEGSGGIADKIVEAWRNRDSLKSDPVMAEIIEDGEIHFHSLDNTVKGIGRLIIRELGEDKVLLQAWETFADYDLNANIQQKKFDRIQLSMIMVGVLGTTLVILQQVFAPRDPEGNLFPARELYANSDIGWWLLYHFLIIIPILLTVLVTAATRFKRGNKWLLLRASAEAIKREIFRYRTRAMYYNENPVPQSAAPGAAAAQRLPGAGQPATVPRTPALAQKISAEQQLSKKVEEITLRTMRTEVNSSALKPYDKGKGFPPDMFGRQGNDDGFTTLSPDRYVEVRLGDQLNYFKRKSLDLDNLLTRLYWLTFIVGGIGTYLAAIGMQVWIALTTSIAAAFGTYLAYRQTESTLTKYNQAATDLSNVKAWWNALSSEEQAQQVNIDSLVEHTEQVLQSELDGWIQQMQNALAELRRGQAEPKEREEKKEPKEPAPAGGANSGDGQAQPNGERGKAAEEQADVATKPAEPRQTGEVTGATKNETVSKDAIAPADEPVEAGGDSMQEDVSGDTPEEQAPVSPPDKKDE